MIPTENFDAQMRTIAADITRTQRRAERRKNIVAVALMAISIALITIALLLPFIVWMSTR